MSSATSVFRVQRDLKEVHDRFGNNSECPPIFASPAGSGDSLSHVLALVVGPPDTPYDGGFFLFDVTFPPSYPNDPPGVRIVTTDFGSIRFNPNLYSNGKVCLSILGTWAGESGGSENWRSSYSLGYVLQCIQCMIMNSEPYHNEPGFDLESLGRLGTGKGPTHNFGLATHSAVAAAAAAGHASAVASLHGPLAVSPVAGASSPLAASTDASPIPKSQSPQSTNLHSSHQHPGHQHQHHQASVGPDGSVDYPSPTVTPPTMSAAFSAPIDVTLDHEVGAVNSGSAMQNQKSVSPEVGTFLDPSDAASPSNTMLFTGSFDGTQASLQPPSAPQQPLQPPLPPLGAVAAAPVGPPRRLAVVLSPEEAERMRAAVRAAAEAYRIKLHHETLRHAVCDTLESLLALTRLPLPPTPVAGSGNNANSNAAVSAPEDAPDFVSSHAQVNPAAQVFEAEIKRQFLMRYHQYERAVTEQRPTRPALQKLHAQHPGTAPACFPTADGSAASPSSSDGDDAAPYRDGEPFPRMPFETGDNQSRGAFRYEWIRTRLARIRTALDEETAQWARRGQVVTAEAASRAYNMQIEVDAAASIQGVCGGPSSSSNLFVWAVTLLPSEGLFEGSAYVVEIVFHPDDAAPPRCRFRQPILHPNISESGVPFTGIDEARLGMKRWQPTAVVTALARLLGENGMVNTASAILNRDAAAGAFSSDPDKLKAFRKQARQLARRTVDE